MRTKRKKRLQFILFVVCVLMIATGLVLYALRQNINLFYTPSQLVAGEAPHHTLVRLGGMVVKGSLKHDSKSLRVDFILSDLKHTQRVTFSGVLPTLFREGQGIVAQGRLENNGVFVATEVLAKHDENYMPPILKNALDKQKEIA